MPLDEIKAAFRPLFVAAGEPSDMAVFTRLESEGRLHCEVIAYFTPAASELAAAFEAQPCDKPARGGLGLLTGHEASLSVLFPESA